MSTLPRPSHKLSWAVFVAALLMALLFIVATAPRLPAVVASHFDADGVPNSFMSHDRYVRFTLGMAVGLPLLLVALLSVTYSRAKTLKLPNRDYWLAPERIAATRALLMAHAAWLGSLLAVLVCFVHWLELEANQLAPPHLSNELFGIGLVVFLIATAVWIGALMVIFRRRGGRPG